MPTLPQNGSKQARRKNWLAGTLGKRESQPSWLDLLLSAAAALLIAALLLGFKLQGIPEYRIGDIADQQVIVPQEVIYEDKEATASRREAARERTPRPSSLRPCLERESINDDGRSGLKAEIPRIKGEVIEYRVFQLGPKIPPDKLAATAVKAGDLFLGRLLVKVAIGHEAPHPHFQGSHDKRVNGCGMVPENELAASPSDHDRGSPG